MSNLAIKERVLNKMIKDLDSLKQLDSNILLSKDSLDDYSNRNDEMIDYYKEFFRNISKSDLNSINAIQKMYSNPTFGFIYFLRNASTGLIKIGYTTKLEKRIKSITSGFVSNGLASPKLELVALLFSHKENLHRLEKYWHNKFKKNRTNGEWFNIDETCLLEEFSLFEGVVVEDDNHDIAIFIENGYVNIDDTIFNYTFSPHEIHKFHDIKKPYNIFEDIRKNPLCEIHDNLFEGEYGYTITDEKYKTLYVGNPDTVIDFFSYEEFLTHSFYEKGYDSEILKTLKSLMTSELK